MLAENNISLSSRGKFASTLLYLEVEIDDNLGKSQRDRLLRDFANLLREALRASDLVGRIGDNCFLALLNNANLDQSKETAFQLKFFISAYNKKIDKAANIKYQYKLKSLDPKRHQNIHQLLSEFV